MSAKYKINVSELKAIPCEANAFYNPETGGMCAVTKLMFGMGVKVGTHITTATPILTLIPEFWDLVANNLPLSEAANLNDSLKYDDALDLLLDAGVKSGLLEVV